MTCTNLDKTMTTETHEVEVTEPTAEPVEIAEQIPEPAPEPTNDDASEQARKVQAAMQKRIDRLTRQRYEEKARADIYESQITQRQAPQKAQDGRPQQAQFETAEDFVEALTDWKLAQREQVAKAQEAQKSQQTIAEKRDKIFTAAEEMGNFDREDFATVPITHPMAEAILDSDVGAKLVVHFNSHPEEAKRIADLPPARQAAEIGKLEVKLSTAPAPKSSAPKPITPLGNGQVTSKDPSQMTDREFALWRQAQIKSR